MAFAQHHAHKDSHSPTPSGVEVHEEINVLGGGVTRVISPKGLIATKNLPENSVPTQSSCPLAPSHGVSITSNVPIDSLVNSGTNASALGNQFPTNTPNPPPDSISNSQIYPEFPLQQSYFPAERQETLSSFNSSTPPLVYANTPDLSGYQSPLEFPSPSQLPQYFNDVFGELGSPMNSDVAMPSEEEQDILKRLCLVSETWQTTMDTVSF